MTSLENVFNAHRAEIIQLPGVKAYGLAIDRTSGTKFISVVVQSEEYMKNIPSQIEAHSVHVCVPALSPKWYLIKFNV